jgi:hypothetical protein
MTFVGKILVIVIMVFSLFFLAVSSVVFSTAKNWREEVTKQKEQVRKQSTQIADLKRDVEEQRKSFDNAKAQHKAETDALNVQIGKLTEENKRRTDERTEVVKQIENAQANMAAAQAEGKARLEDANNLRELLTGVQKQNNELKLQQTELNDKIRELERENQLAQSNNRDLRTRVALLSDSLREHGLSTDVRQIRSRGTAPPNDVEGEVLRVQNNRIEISIGSDDGLSEGNELDVYHLKPAPEYVGKIRIESVSSDHAVGKVIGQTVRGIKIKEGDLVATKIRSRG